MSEYARVEKIVLDPDKVTKNAGHRTVSKLLLNSLWGKFSQRSNMTKTMFVDSSQGEQFFQTVFDPSLDVSDFRIVSPSIVQIVYKHGANLMPDNTNANIFIGMFTTCSARLRLLKDMRMVCGDGTPPQCRLLYSDTDSLLNVSEEGLPEPALRDYLGDLTSDLKENRCILENCSAGPKNYAYVTNDDEEVCKVHGSTLNYANAKLINFDAVKESRTVVSPSKITRDKKLCKILSKREEKTYKMVYTKRIILSNLDTIPYGYE